jgi:peptidoglycan-associated lipoprotein
MKNVKSIIAVASLGFALAACSGSAPQTSSGSTSGSSSSSYSSTYGGGSSLSSDQFLGVNVGDRVFFATDQASIDGSSRAVLRAQAEWLAQNASTSLVIEGHADAVRDFLISQGVDSARLETISFGKERPVSLCSEESCWSKNRRAVSTPR